MTSIRRLLVIGASCVCLYLQVRDLNGSPASPQIAIRGYYFTFCRMPTFGFETWKEIFDRIHQDGGNQVLLWMGGGFRSKKFPVTWQYNRDA